MSHFNGDTFHPLSRKRSRRYDHHGRIHQPCAIHCRQDIEQFQLQMTQPRNMPVRSRQALRLLAQTRLHQPGMQIDDMRHHRRAQHRYRQVQARAIHHRHHYMQADLVPSRMHQENLDRITDTDHHDEHHDDRFQFAKAEAVERENAEHADCGCHSRQQQHFRPPHSCSQQARTQQQVETQRRAQKLRQVCREGRKLGRHPKKNRHAPRKVVAAILRQRSSGRNSQLGRKVLDQDCHGIRPQQNPQQLVAKARPAIQVRNEITRIDIGNARHKRRPHRTPQFPRANARFAWLALDRDGGGCMHIRGRSSARGSYHQV